MGKDKGVEDTTDTTETTTTETETQEPVLPTNKEELDALKAAAIEQGRLEAEDKYKGIQRTINKKNDEIERLKRKPTQPPINDFSLEEALIASKRGEVDANDPVIAQLEQALATRKRAATEQANAQYRDKIIGEQGEKFNKQIEDAGLDPDDERLDDFHDKFDEACIDGLFDKAERKLNRILSKVEPKKGKTESEDDTKAKWIEEGKRLGMEKMGLLKTDNNQPSGAGSSDEEFERKMGSGELPMTAENMKRAQSIIDKRTMGG